jgi:phosphoribosylanthranilate isomerase
VEAILRELPPFVEAVGVFVNEDLEKACERAFRFGRIGTLQMLADEDAKPQAAGNAFPFQLIAAFRVSDRSGLQEIDRYLELCGERSCLPAAVLVDAFVSGQYGGTGRTAPWDLLADFRIEVPLILAGGLTAGNVAEAVRIVRPYGIDVASGVELQPGRKDPDKMRRFIDNARSV